MICIQLNGLDTHTSAQTLNELVESLDLSGKRFAVEVDGALVPKSKLDTVGLQEGMQIEIVVAVGGG